MANNIVSQPPLTTPIVDISGMTSKAWSIWFRDLYTRTSFKGGNAIDDNKAETDQELLNLNSTLQATISAVNQNTTNIETNKTNLETHESLDIAHNSNGKIVGFDDLSNETTQGLVKRMALIADAIQSIAGVAVSDVSSAPASYSQSHSQELTDMANANKSAINLLVTDFNNAVIVLNNLLAESKNSGQMST